jgi:hypothetical protein
MASESGHAPNRAYFSQSGDIHLNGATLFDGNENPVSGVAKAASATFSPASSTSNVCLVTIQVLDGSGNAITGPVNLDIWLSDAATGLGLTATSASGTVVAGASGTDLGDYTAKKAKRVQTTAAGLYILQITDTGKTGFYVCTEVGGKIQVSAQLVTGNYG